MSKRPIQPKAKKHYLTKEYEDFNLWLDYWVQKSLIEETKPNNILEIGKGTGTLESIMEREGFKYTTIDIDKSLSPDYVGDITKLPFKDNSFDTVCAFEVLEHIPFDEFPHAIKEMNRVAKKFVIISLPYACIYFGFAFQFFYMKKFEKLFKFLHLKAFEPNYINLALPLFFLNKQGMIKAHAWEMGRNNYPVSRIKNIIRDTGLTITKEISRMFYPYHRFFVAKKTQRVS